MCSTPGWVASARATGASFTKLGRAPTTETMRIRRATAPGSRSPPGRSYDKSYTLKPLTGRSRRAEIADVTSYRAVLHGGRNDSVRLSAGSRTRFGHGPLPG